MRAFESHHIFHHLYFASLYAIVSTQCGVVDKSARVRLKSPVFKSLLSHGNSLDEWNS